MDHGFAETGQDVTEGIPADRRHASPRSLAREEGLGEILDADSERSSPEPRPGSAFRLLVDDNDLKSLTKLGSPTSFSANVSPVR